MTTRLKSKLVVTLWLQDWKPCCLTMRLKSMLVVTLWLQDWKVCWLLPYDYKTEKYAGCYLMTTRLKTLLLDHETEKYAGCYLMTTRLKSMLVATLWLQDWKVCWLLPYDYKTENPAAWPWDWKVCWLLPYDYKTEKYAGCYLMTTRLKVKSKLVVTLWLQDWKWKVSWLLPYDYKTENPAACHLNDYKTEKYAGCYLMTTRLKSMLVVTLCYGYLMVTWLWLPYDYKAESEKYAGCYFMSTRLKSMLVVTLWLQDWKVCWFLPYDYKTEKHTNCYCYRYLWHSENDVGNCYHYDYKTEKHTDCYCYIYIFDTQKMILVTVITMTVRLKMLDVVLNSYRCQGKCIQISWTFVFEFVITCGGITIRDICISFRWFEAVIYDILEQEDIFASFLRS